MIQWIGRWFEAWDSFDVELKDVVHIDDKLMVEIWMEGRGGGSGLEVSRPGFHVFELREGKILRMYEFDSRPDALQAAGADT